MVNANETALQAAVLVFNLVSSISVISVNKHAFNYFPYPAALTCIHYAVSWLGTELLLCAGAFHAKRVDPRHIRPFLGLVVSWTLCNALSNVSLERNSVGFYQMMKIMVTPTVVLVDFVAYGKVTTGAQLLALVFTCVGVGLVSVNDVQFNWNGAIMALLAVFTAVIQKILNSHMQQHCDLSSLQLMRQCFPLMTALSLIVIPLMDPPGLTSFDWLSPHCLGLVLLSAFAAFMATWSATLIFGLISALAHVLLGQLKTASVLLIGALFFDARSTPKGLAGAALALVSITVFTLLKLKLPCPWPARGSGGTGAARGGHVGSGASDSESEGTPLTSS